MIHGTVTESAIIYQGPDSFFVFFCVYVAMFRSLGNIYVYFIIYIDPTAECPSLMN